MKPLSIEEIKQLKEYDYFWLVNINDTNKNIYISNISYTKETLAGLDFYNNFRRMKWDNYGKTWVAYKNKEQAECDNSYDLLKVKYEIVLKEYAKLKRKATKYNFMTKTIDKEITKQAEQKLKELRGM